MKQINLKDLIEKVKEIGFTCEEILGVIEGPDIIIADFPAVEKKIRKKRAKKEKTVILGPLHPDLPEEPKRGRRGRKAGYHLGPNYIQSTLMEVETPKGMRGLKGE
jgi:hypothetical protein